MKVYVYVLCYNEMKLAPFAVQYWKEYADKVIVYDNGSDDGVIEYLSRFPFVEIRHFDSDGIDDSKFLEIKNNVWKEARGEADFVVVGDFDEFVYSDDLKGYLQRMKDNNITICTAKWYDLISEDFPVFDENILLHKNINVCESNCPKTLLFDPNKIQEINYAPGAHTCDPNGEVKFDTGGYCVFHAVNVGLDFIIDKCHKRAARLSSINKRNGWGYHYNFTDERIKSDFYNQMSRSIKWKN